MALSHIKYISLWSLDNFEKEGSSIKGFATLVIEQCFTVKGITIYEGKNGYFCSMPSKNVNAFIGIVWISLL